MPGLRVNGQRAIREDRGCVTGTSNLHRHVRVHPARVPPQIREVPRFPHPDQPPGPCPAPRAAVLRVVQPLLWACGRAAGSRTALATGGTVALASRLRRPQQRSVVFPRRKLDEPLAAQAVVELPMNASQ